MRHGTLVLGLVGIGIVVALAVVGLFWMPFDPAANGPTPLAPPGWPHLLGTDAFGSDIFSRIINGAKVCLLVSLVSVSAAALVGVPIVLAYTIWSYHVFRRRLSVANMPPEPGSAKPAKAQAAKG